MALQAFANGRLRMWRSLPKGLARLFPPARLPRNSLFAVCPLSLYTHAREVKPKHGTTSGLVPPCAAVRPRNYNVWHGATANSNEFHRRIGNCVKPRDLVSRFGEVKLHRFVPPSLSELSMTATQIHPTAVAFLSRNARAVCLHHPSRHCATHETQRHVYTWQRLPTWPAQRHYVVATATSQGGTQTMVQFSVAEESTLPCPRREPHQQNGDSPMHPQCRYFY